MSEPIAADLVAQLRAALRTPALELATPLERLHGGFGTVTFAFRLAGAPPAYSGPLVLRLFKAISPPERVLREASVQQAAIEAGIPAARPLLHSAVPAIAGRAFLVMERATGATLLAALRRSPWAALDLGARLAREQLRIHAVPVEPLARRLREAGVALRDLRSLLAALEEKVGSLGDARLRRGLEWLRADAVARGGEIHLCHGDFHPGNLLAERGRVTAVLDWTSAALAEREWDVAQTLLLLRSAPLRFGAALGGLRRGLAHRYLAAYRAAAPLEDGRLHYYGMLHAFHAFVLAEQMREHRAGGRVEPHEPGTAWEWPAGRHALAKLFARGSGIPLC